MCVSVLSTVSDPTRHTETAVIRHAENNSKDRLCPKAYGQGKGLWHKDRILKELARPD